MPKVVPDQFEKFNNDVMFKKLKQGSEIHYTGSKESLHEDRTKHLLKACYLRELEISLASSGLTLELLFESTSGTSFISLDLQDNRIDFCSRCILNGVCVLVKGFLNINTLCGTGRVEFDSETAQKEDMLLRDQIRHYNNNNMLTLQQLHQSKQQHFQIEQQQDQTNHTLKHGFDLNTEVCPAWSHTFTHSGQNGRLEKQCQEHEEVTVNGSQRRDDLKSKELTEGCAMDTSFKCQQIVNPMNLKSKKKLKSKHMEKKQQIEIENGKGNEQNENNEEFIKTDKTIKNGTIINKVTEMYTLSDNTTHNTLPNNTTNNTLPNNTSNTLPNNTTHNPLPNNISHNTLPNNTLPININIHITETKSLEKAQRDGFEDGHCHWKKKRLKEISRSLDSTMY